MKIIISISMVMALFLTDCSAKNDKNSVTQSAHAYKPSNFNFFGAKIGEKKENMPYPSLKCPENRCEFLAYEYKPITDKFGNELVRVITVTYDDNNIAYKIDAFSSILVDPKKRDEYLNVYNGLKINDPYLKFNIGIGKYRGMDQVIFSVIDTKIENDLNERIKNKSSKIINDAKNFGK
jgi:hypothetical protein